MTGASLIVMPQFKYLLKFPNELPCAISQSSRQFRAISTWQPGSTSELIAVATANKGACCSALATVDNQDSFSMEVASPTSVFLFSSVLLLSGNGQSCKPQAEKASFSTMPRWPRSVPRKLSDLIVNFGVLSLFWSNFLSRSSTKMLFSGTLALF